MRLLAPVTALLACATLGCGSSSSPGKPLALPRSPEQISSSARSHFVVMVLENRELGEVAGSGSAPYVNALARSGTLASDYHAISHPSLPNYLALVAGSTLGIGSDCTGCRAYGATLMDQLEQAHLSWRAYMEGMPRPCYAGAAAGGYAKKHDPFMYFPQIASNAGRCRQVVPLTQLAGDLRADRLPAFAWITPNLCDDGHDCATAAVNRFLARLTPYLLRALGPQGVLALVWDEGAGNSGCCGGARGGRVPLILLGPPVKSGYRLATPANHYSLLRLIEDAFGLGRLRGADCSCTPSLNAALRGGTPPSLAGDARAARARAPGASPAPARAQVGAVGSSALASGAGGPWLGLNGNSANYLGPIGRFAQDRVVYDREEYRAGVLPRARDGLARAIAHGMIPVVVIEYPGYDGHVGTDPRFPRGAGVSAYVRGFLRTATAVLRAYPGRQILFEAINEPYYRASAGDYAAVLAQLLPAAQRAGIPLDTIYAAAFGKGWVPAMYAAQPSLRTLVGGWNFHPYGPSSGTAYEYSLGIQSVPHVRAQMASGKDNVIVSELGWCARSVNHGHSCGEPATITARQAARELTSALQNALPMRRAGWLKALLVYSRNDGGWAMELPGGALTEQGRALIRFALTHPS